MSLAMQFRVAVEKGVSGTLGSIQLRHILLESVLVWRSSRTLVAARPIESHLFAHTTQVPLATVCRVVAGLKMHGMGESHGEGGER